MIKAVILDLGGVYFTDGTKIAIEKISKEYDLQTAVVEKVLRTRSELGSSIRRGEITTDEFWNRAKNLLKLDANNDDLNRTWIESYEPIQDSIKIIKKLKKKGIKLFFLSDNVKDRIEYLQKKYNFLENFVDGIFSYEVHKTKYDGIEIFEIALEKIGEKPENVLYVDDKENYVNIAKKLGMNVILFRSPKQLKEKLDHYF